MSARIEKRFARLLESDPDAVHEAIVRAVGTLDQLIDSLPDSLEVRYTYRLIKAVAVSGRAADLLALRASPCVLSIEAVGTVTSIREDCPS